MPAGPLSHVRWIGGGSGAGKTAVAKVLAERAGLQVYCTDDVIAGHGAQPREDSPLLAAFARMSMDERWLLRSPEEMCRTFPWFAGELFDAIVRDLAATSPQHIVIAEGFRLLPRLVAPLLPEKRSALWLLPTPEFRRRVFEERPTAAQFWRRTSDPAAALQRLLDRDALFTTQLRQEATDLQLRVIDVDGATDETALVDQVAEWLRL